MNKLLEKLKAYIDAEFQKIRGTAPAGPAADDGAITAELREFVATEIGKELTQIKADMATARQTISTLMTEVTEKIATVTRQEQEISALKKERGEKDEEIAALKANIADPSGEIRKTAAARTAEQIAANGHQPINIKDSPGPLDPNDKTLTLTQRVEAHKAAQVAKVK
jgi:septal ring factor EnvC (AmiA/AmiB activator)